MHPSQVATQLVLEQVTEFQANGELNFPSAYSPQNALKCAFLVLSDKEDKNGKFVLQSCSKESIARALMKMVTDGLTTIKNQCYFIPYAGRLDYMRSYLGSETLLKRDANGKSIIASAIYEDDDFSFSIKRGTGIKEIIKHESTLDSLSTPVVGAYCIITFNDDSQYIEIMNIDQIKKAWDQRKGKGLSPAHENFPDEMAKKTVISRACKPFINTTDDSNLIIDRDKADSLHQINENANTIDIEVDEVAPAPESEVKENDINKGNLKGAGKLAFLPEKKINKEAAVPDLNSAKNGPKF